MPKLYYGVSDSPKEIEKMWIGVSDSPKEIEKMWIGDANNNPKLIYDGGDLEEAPANFTVTSDTDTSVSFSWTAVTDATNYSIRYKRNNSNVWSIFGTNFTGTTGTVTGLNSNSAYNFQIRALVDSEYTAWSSMVTEVTDPTLTKLATPTNVHVNYRSAHSITFDWTQVTNADGYHYGFREKGTNTYSYHNIGNQSQWFISGLDSCTEYEFIVRAYAGGYLTSNFSPTFTAGTNPIVPGDFRVGTSSADSVRFHWDEVSCATSYELSYGDTTVSTTNTEIEIDGLERGESITARVRTKWNNLYSFYSSYKTAYTKPPVPTGLSVTSRTNTSMTLDWDDAESATQYQVQVNSTNYTFSNSHGTIVNLSSGSTNTVRVTSYGPGGSASAYSPSITVVLPPATPANLSLSASGTTITAAFDSSSGATLYRIADDGTSVATGTSSPITFTGTAGTTHDVSVRAEKSGGNSAYSDEEEIDLAPNAPSFTLTQIHVQTYKAMITISDFDNDVYDYEFEWYYVDGNEFINETYTAEVFHNPEIINASFFVDDTVYVRMRSSYNDVNGNWSAWQNITFE